MWFLRCFFFFKQKPAYEMRISDWSSDVCSSDLGGGVGSGAGWGRGAGGGAALGTQPAAARAPNINRIRMDIIRTAPLSCPGSTRQPRFRSKAPSGHLDRKSVV